MIWRVGVFPFELAANVGEVLLCRETQHEFLSATSKELGGVRVVTRCVRAVPSNALNDLTRASFFPFELAAIACKGRRAQEYTKRLSQP